VLAVFDNTDCLFPQLLDRQTLMNLESFVAVLR
jgi:hypothetical protein